MASTKSLAHLPFDIHDTIFDFVRQDDIDTRKRTLFAASGVSKEWADMSMRARFHTLSLVVKLEGETSIIKFFLQDFVQEPIFEELKKCQCVKKLTLRWSREGSKSEIDFETILPHHLPLFPGLLSLELRGVLYKRPTARLTQRFNMQSLTINGHLYHYHSQWYHDQRALCDLLCLFPSLKGLKLTDMYTWAHDYFTEPDAGIRWDDALPHIQSVVFDQSTPAPALVQLFKTAGVKYLDVSGIRFSRHTEEHLLVANACAATLQHLNYELFCARDTIEAQEAPANINLANLPELRRLTLAIEINGVDSIDAGDAPHHEPWSTLATTLATLRKRLAGAPALEYVDLRLEPYRPDQYSNYDEEPPMSRNRRALTHSKTFSSCVDAELDSLVDAGLVEAVRVGFGGGSRKSVGMQALRPHSCLDDLLIAAFPTLHAKGRLHLGNETCECEHQ